MAICNTLLQIIARRFAFLLGFPLLFHPDVLGGKGTEGAGCLAIFRRSLMVSFAVVCYKHTIEDGHS